MKRTESEIADQVIDYLSDLRWDIYQEVQIYSGSSCADIVAVQNPIVWVIETKTTAGLKVLEQAVRWKYYANMVSVAVPVVGKSSRFFENVSNKFGIGVLRVGNEVIESQVPSINRKAPKTLKEGLLPEHKTYAQAGNSDGKRWTPFKSTCLSVLRVVRSEPGILIKDLIRVADHHYASYSSAKNCLVKWIDAGIVKGVEIRRVGRELRVYPTTKSV